MKDLKTRTVRGGVAKTAAQAANFLVRTASLMVLARLLDPTDFGLVGMVTAITGFLSLFREFGLSLATVQRSEVTDGQTSTLFWVNVLVGVVLCVSSVAIAPLVALFYHEPRLQIVMAVLGLGFLFNAAGVQHSAKLQREMRFVALAVIDVVALVISSAISLGMALNGFGYWSLVGWSVAVPLTTTIQLWFYTRWTPGKPSRDVGVESMLRFGGVVTLNTLVVHLAYNLDKILLGRFWGAEVVGLYGRAYQLITLPTDQITGTVGSIAISVLSRLQNDRKRLWAYFQKGYALVLAVTVPVGVICFVFASEIVLVMFGPKWADAIPVFRALVPTVLVFAIINPTGWLLIALGMIGRSLKLALVIAPLVITGCVIGLPYGAVGVAIGFSTAMALWVIPHLVWCFHGLGGSFRDVLLAIGRPLLSGAVGALCALGVKAGVGPQHPPLLTLVLGGAVFGVAYLCVLLFVLRQRAFYLEIVRSLRGASSEPKAFVV